MYPKQINSSIIYFQINFNWKCISKNEKRQFIVQRVIIIGIKQIKNGKIQKKKWRENEENHARITKSLVILNGMKKASMYNKHKKTS